MNTRAQIQRVIALADEITDTGVGNAFVYFSGHIHGLSVYVHAPDAQYDDPEDPPPRVYDSGAIYLSWPDAEDRIQGVVEALSEMLEGVQHEHARKSL